MLSPVVLGKDGTTVKLVGLFLDMTDWVVAGDGPGFDYSVVTGMPALVLVHDV
jgi:hypothetical protein